MINLTLKNKLTIIAILIVVVPLFIFYVVFSSITSKTLEENAVNEMSMTLENISQTIDVSLNSIQSIVSVAKNAPAFVSYVHNLRMGIADEKSNRALYEMSDRIVFGESYIETFFTVYDGKLHIINDRDSIGVDVSDRDYVQATMSGQPFLTDVFVSRSTGNYVFVYAEPIYDGTRVVAVVALALNFHDYVSSYLEGFTVGTTGYPWMIDADGLTVYHPNPAHIQQTVITEIGLERLENIAKRMIRGETGTGYYEFEGIEKLTVFGPVSNWHLALTIDNHEVFAHVNQFKRVILLTAFVLTICVLAVSFPILNRTIVNPLKEIKDLVNKISEGDYKSRISAFSKDDIGFLAKQINNMAQRLGENTEKVRLQNEAIKGSEERLNAILNFLPDATFAIDLEGKVILWNMAMEEMTGIRAEEILGKGDHEYTIPFYGHKRPVLANLVLDPDPETEQKYSVISRAGDKSLVAESFAPFIGKQGMYLWTKATPLYDAQGNITGVIEAIRDITDRKQAEQKIAGYNIELEELYSQLDEEIQKAANIHKRTLPAELPAVAGISFAAHYQPARLMGSDFYNVIKVHNKLLLYLSDVSGHGMEGAMLSVFIKEAIDSYIRLKQEHIRPGEILGHLDHQYRRQNYPDNYFICIFLAVLDLETMELSFSSAGFQNTPLLHMGNNDRLELGDSDLPVMSALPRELLDFHEANLTLAPGSTLLFTTDGLPEQIADGKQYNRRLAQVFFENSFLPPEGIVQLINEDFKHFNNSSLQGEDDITFLIMQLDASSRKNKRLAVKSNFKELDHLSDHISSMIHNFGEKETLINTIHEMVANAIEHGNKFDPEKKVSIEIATADRFVYAVVEDEGEGHNWRGKLEAELDYEGKDFRGRGIILSRILCERLFYNEKGNKAFIMVRGDEKNAS